MKPYIFIGALAFALAVLGKTFLLEQLPATDPDQASQALTLQQPCDLRQAPCTASDAAGHAIRFSISPNTIPVMQELAVSAETTGWGEVGSARLSVAGVNMFMGYQYADLSTDGAAVLRGKLVLPVCTLEAMQWQATLLVQTDTGQVSATFPFESSR